MTVDKIDPHKNKESYFKWKEKAESSSLDIGRENSEMLMQYLQDMEIGINVGNAAKKGPRSFIHLNSSKNRLIGIMRKAQGLYNLKKFTDISEEQAHKLFSKMRTGEIVRPDGKKYMAVADAIKIFKAFWHWHQRVNKKKGVEIADITADLDSRQEKPDWVYLTENEVKKLAEKARHDYKVLIWFLFDTGIRAPTELMNLRVSDFHNDFKELQIKQEISKTFGRRIKLMICSELIKDYIQDKKLSGDDFVFTTKPAAVNRYLKRLSTRIFGEEKTPAGQRYCDLTMYDFRHNSCCYWLPRYKSESALKYRFGWKSSDKIHYYSELLGMKDTISEDDMLIDVTKTEIEQRLGKSEKENLLLREDNEQMKLQIAKITELTARIYQQMKVNQEMDA